MKVRAGADHFGLHGECHASLGDRLVQIVERLEVAVDQRLVDEEPQVLGRLQLGAVRRLIDEPNAVGNGEVVRPVPAGPNLPASGRTSSCTTARFFLPTPIDLAKSARMASNISLQMAFETFHTVRPVAGSTNPVT